MKIYTFITMAEAIAKVESLGYQAEPSGDKYIIGRKGSSIQWFKLDRCRLMKRVDYHVSYFGWEEVQ